MGRRQHKEINVFSTSAIDLFASGMGVFILLVVATIPYFSKVSKTKINMDAKTVEELVREVNNLTQVNSQFLNALTAQTKQLGKVETEIRQLAALGKSAKTKVEEVKNVAQTIRAMQSVIKDLTQSIRLINQQQQETSEKLRRKIAEIKKIQNSVKDQFNKTPFVAVLLRWDTSRHDLDLKVFDPDGVEHSFKNKSDQVFADSRIGPGGEIWFAEKPKPGTYTAKVYFHGAYGNNNPATVHISLVDRRKVYVVDPLQIKRESEIVEVSQFSVSQDGKITIIDRSGGSSTAVRQPAQERVR